LNEKLSVQTFFNDDHRSYFKDLSHFSVVAGEDIPCWLDIDSYLLAISGDMDGK
jgi:hypothetical protein